MKLLQVAALLLSLGGAAASLGLMSSTVQGAEAAHPSAGCTSGVTPPGGERRLEAKDGRGRTRNYLLQMPDGYQAGTPYGLVFVFHGLGGNSQERSAGLRETADAARRAIFVSPQGAEYQSYGVGWDDSAKGYDLPFFDAMLSQISASLCVDQSRIFAAGFSWGADFTTTLACTRGDALRAVVINSADDEFSDHNDFRSYQNYPCPGIRHPAIFFQHAVDSDEAYPAPLFATTSKLYRDLNACQGGAELLTPRSTVLACVTYRSCATQVTECFFDHKLGHRRPPGWAEDAWQFLASF